MLAQNTRSMGNQRDSTLNLTNVNDTTDQDASNNDINLSIIDNKKGLEGKTRKNIKNENIDKIDFIRKFEDYQEIYKREKKNAIKKRSKSSDMLNTSSNQSLLGFNTKAFKNKDDIKQLRNVYENSFLPKEEVSI